MRRQQRSVPERIFIVSMHKMCISWILLLRLRLGLGLGLGLLQLRLFVHRRRHRGICLRACSDLSSSSLFWNAQTLRFFLDR